MRVWLLGSVEATRILLDFLGDELSLVGLIGLSQESASSASGFVSMADIAMRQGLLFEEAQRYDLMSSSDQTAILKHEIDVLVVFGWQRLVPEWLLSHCKIGAIGAHGSAYGISGGRGRSPQNWALILGEKQFSLSLFWLRKDADSGPLISTVEFDYSTEDDINSSYIQVCGHISKMLVAWHRDDHIGQCEYAPQSNEVYYLPKRVPSDGAIDWTRPIDNVCQFVRALTRPYPGAFCHFDNGRETLVIWSARPVKLDVTNATEPGTILSIVEDRILIIRGSDGIVVTQDFEIVSNQQEGPRPCIGMVLQSVDFASQLREIVNRHQAEYPDQKIAPALLRAAGC